MSFVTNFIDGEDNKNGNDDDDDKLYGNYCPTSCMSPTDNGYVYCLFAVDDPSSDLIYMSLYNDGSVDGATTYDVTCMVRLRESH